jgi:7-cyano-7-deazaguanine synthase
MGDLLLLSGGLDSSCVALRDRPAAALVVDYGQRPAAAEAAAAAVIAAWADIPLLRLEADCAAVGAGLMGDGNVQLVAPSPEWWPFRNQLLVTLAASVAVQHGYDAVVVASVSTDAERHIDGSADFYAVLDRLVSMQEGNVRVMTPVISSTTDQLLASVELPDDILIAMHSCQVANVACGWCPGCLKRQDILRRAGRFLATPLPDE